MFPSRSFMFSVLTFESLNNFELIFVSDVSYGSGFIFLHVNIQLSQHHWLKRLSFSIEYFWFLCQIISWPYIFGFISGLSNLFHWCMCLFLCQFWSVMPLALFLFLKIFFWLFRVFCSSIRISVVLFPTSVKYTFGILIRIALNLWLAFGSIDILTILILPIHEHGVPFHLFVYSSTSFSVLEFSE